VVNHPNRSKRHTPGPWRDEHTKAAGHYFVAGERGIRLGMWIEGPGLGHQADANRRLMLAAPDLLDVARMLIEANDCIDNRFSVGDCVMRARAALAKAEG
jgi:hypothetical protein